MNKKLLLLGASALAAAAAMATAGAASAQTQIYGAGSTLVAPYMRQAEDCYGVPTGLVNQGGYPYLANETVNNVSPFYYSAGTGFNCGTQHVDGSVQLNYNATGSGNGIAGFFGHDPVTYWGDTIVGTSPSPWPSVQYGASDASLNGSDVAHYNCVGGSDCTEGSAGSHTLQHIIGTTSSTVAGTVAGDGGINYANPTGQFGAMIQFPLLVAPVAIAYSGTYKEVADSTGHVTYYKFKIHKPNKDTSGGLLLDMPTVCAIFNGQITNWNDAALKALNGGVSLQDPTDPAGAAGWASTGLPIELVGRSDSSGTTSIFVRALAAQCGTTGVNYTEGGDNYTYNNNYPAAGSKTLFGLNSGSLGPVFVKGAANNGAGDLTVPVAGQFTIAKGNDGVANYVAFRMTPPASTTYTQGRITYIGPDYALPAVLNTGQNTYGINVADIFYNTKTLEPTGPNALKAFGTGTTAYLPPQSNSGGVYENGTVGHLPAATSFGLRSHPEDWALPISTTVSYEGAPAVANSLAAPTTVGAYPIVGTTVGFFYTCYNDSSSPISTDLKAFLTWYTLNTANNRLVMDPTVGLLVKAGLSPLPAAWLKAIDATFLTPTVSAKTNTFGTNSLSLNIRAAGAAAILNNGRSYQGQCASVTPGA